MGYKWIIYTFVFLYLLTMLCGLKASTVTWEGTTNTNLNTASNYIGGVVPGSSDEILFNDVGASNSINLAINSGFTIDGIRVEGTTEYTLVNMNPHIFSVQSGGITNNSTQTFTLVNVEMRNTVATINANTADIFFNSVGSDILDIRDSDITFAGANDITINRNWAGNSNTTVVKTGTGDLILDMNVTSISGAEINIREGTLITNNSGGLFGVNIVLDGGTFETNHTSEVSIGSLTLTNNSTLNLGTGGIRVTGNPSGTFDSGYTLTVINYNDSLNSWSSWKNDPHPYDQYSNQIVFVDPVVGGNTYFGSFYAEANGFYIEPNLAAPVPESSTYFTAVMLLILSVFYFYKKRY